MKISRLQLHKMLTLIIASVWLINGLFAKVFNFVPRHEQIVSRILSENYSALLIKAIGIGEIFLAFWILSRIWCRLNAIIQITLVATMNIIEFIFARDLLLWGGANAFFAFIFIGIVYYNEFILNSKLEEK